MGVCVCVCVWDSSLLSRGGGELCHALSSGVRRKVPRWGGKVVSALPPAGSSEAAGTGCCSRQDTGLDGPFGPIQAGCFLCVTPLSAHPRPPASPFPQAVGAPGLPGCRPRAGRDSSPAGEMESVKG